jgi:hypothetical protein
MTYASATGVIGSCTTPTASHHTSFNETVNERLPSQVQTFPALHHILRAESYSEKCDAYHATKIVYTFAFQEYLPVILT